MIIYGCMCCVYITYLYVQLHVCVPVYVYVEYNMSTCNTVKLSRCMMVGICKYVCVEVFTYGSRMHMPYFCLCFKFWLHVYYCHLLSTSMHVKCMLLSLHQDPGNSLNGSAELLPTSVDVLSSANSVPQPGSQQETVRVRPNTLAISL